MRTRTWLVLVPVFAAAAGLVAVGCGDDTTMATGGTDAAPDTGGGGQDATKTDTSTGGDAAKETGTDAAKEAAACMDASFNVATFDSGSPVWACYQQMCAKDDAGMPGALPQCAADCTCNSAFATALLCVADGGMNTTCFTPAVGSGSLAMNWYLNCFMNFMGACADGGPTMTPPDAGDAAPMEAGEAAPPDGGGTDGGDSAAD